MYCSSLKKGFFALFFVLAVLWVNSFSREIDSIPGTEELNRNKIPFEIKKIPSDEAESTAFGDFNGDGIPDVVAGNEWYEGPTFTNRHKFRTLHRKGFATPDDMLVTIDVDKDGYDEVISGGHDFGVFMYKNPGKNGGAWVRHIIDADRPPNGNVDTAIASGLPHTLGWHSGGLVDIDGDGKKEELLSTGVRAASKMNMRWYKYINGSWKRHDLGVKCHQWGSGVGDINGDGKTDIICPDAWLEKTALGWVRHEFRSSILGNIARTQEPEPSHLNGHGVRCAHATQIYTYDVNKDGLNDILIAAAHGYGVYWYEQKMVNGNRTFLEHAIDLTWSGAHNLEFEDIDNDGDPDLITGKRWGIWKPDAFGANVLYWYELTPGKNNPWTRHVLSYNNGIGQGNKGDVKDYDGDGDLDILANSKENKFVYLFENKLDPEPVDTSGSASIEIQQGDGIRIHQLESHFAIYLTKDAKVRVVEYDVNGRFVRNVLNEILLSELNHTITTRKGFVYELYVNDKLYIKKQQNVK